MHMYTTKDRYSLRLCRRSMQHVADKCYVHFIKAKYCPFGFTSSIFSQEHMCRVVVRASSCCPFPDDITNRERGAQYQLICYLSLPSYPLPIMRYFDRFKGRYVPLCCSWRDEIAFHWQHLEAIFARLQTVKQKRNLDLSTI